MAGTSFKTNPILLHEVLDKCRKGEVQLPDFQRSWVWDEERIRGLLASISQAFPCGAIMTLETGGKVEFAARPIQGAPDDATKASPHELLLDGQQRLTSLYQTCMRDEPVKTITPKKRRVERLYYIDIGKALDPNVPREEAIVGVGPDRKRTGIIQSESDIDVSTRDLEIEHMLFPVAMMFDWDSWQVSVFESGDKEKWELFKKFKDEVLENFKAYQIPVIALGKDTTREAVCLVFEKVNTGGKPLDAFELVTATFAMDNFDLRQDWMGDAKSKGRLQRLTAYGAAAGRSVGVLAKLQSTDFLQAISLLATLYARRQAVADGKPESQLPRISANRATLLNLSLDDYKRFAEPVEKGFETVAKFLREVRVNRVEDLPYQTQLVPLAAIFAEIGNRWEDAEVRRKLRIWYWNGVFGEMYGSASETRMARDLAEVLTWLDDGPLPSTIMDADFRAHRLDTMRTRLSAAYKGVHALLMVEGAKDFRSGQDYDQTVFFDESVDIHHIFPRAWCEKQKIEPKVYDSIVNKTPLAARTNRTLGGRAPSDYLATLERGTTNGSALAPDVVDAHLESHLIEPEWLRADDFDGFYAARRRALLNLIAKAMDREIQDVADDEEGVDASDDADVVEEELSADAA